MRITKLEAFQSLKLPPKKYGSMRGMYFSKKNDRKIYYESNLEKNTFELLDWLPEIVQYREQPLTIHFELEGINRSYRPDIIIDIEPYCVGRKIHDNIPEITSTTIIAEVKTEEDLLKKADELEMKFSAAKLYCKDKGYQFITISDKIYGRALKNMVLLNQYKGNEVTEDIEQELFKNIQFGKNSIAKIISTFTSIEHRLKIQRSIMVMLGNNRLEVNMNKRITNESELNIRG